MIRSAILLLLTTLATELSAQQDTVFIEDLSSAWQTFDEAGNSIPYIERKSDIVFFELPPSEPGVLLRIEAKVPFDIWIGDQIYRNNFKGTASLNVDSVRNFHLDNPTLTFYGKDWRQTELNTRLLEVIGSSNGLLFGRISKKGHLDQNSYLLIVGLLLVMAGVYRRFFAATFSKSYSNPLSLKLRGLSAEDAYASFFSFDNLYALMYLGVLGSLLSYYLGYQLISLGLNPDWMISVPRILLVALIGVLMLLMKFIWSNVAGYIFQFKDLPNIQNQDFIHFLILLTSIALVLSSVDYTLFNFTSEKIRWFIVILYVILLIFFQFWMILKFDKFYSHRKLMIITYLCTTEFLPCFVIIYWLLKS